MNRIFNPIYLIKEEKLCINHDKNNKHISNYYIICDDCGYCYTSFYENCEITIVLEKYNEKEYIEVSKILRSELS